MSKLYVVSPPPEIFERITPAIHTRIVTLPDFLRYPQGKVKQLTRSLLVGRVPLPQAVMHYWFPKKYFEVLTQARQGDAVLIYECCNVRVLKAIRPFLAKEVPCYIYYCNPIRSICHNPHEQLTAIKKLGYRLSTFDPHDAETYGLDYTGQYFCSPSHMPITFSSDCFFCGLPKDRFNELWQLKYLLEKEGLECNFIIPRKPDERISYKEYLHQLSQTRCVIDIAQQHQMGLTRRPLEALFYQKKLITNNPEIMHYDFYNRENIFILGQDSPDRLKEFVESPFNEIPETIRQAYDVNHWIQNYLPKEIL